MRVVVIGAGLAGLTAAERLVESGAEVCVLEGGSRVGGRARTVADVFSAGQVAESGAEWVDTDHVRMLGLIRRFGLQLEGEGQVWTVLRRLLHRHGQLHDATSLRRLAPTLTDELDAYAQLFERMAAGIVDPSAPQLHPDAALIDSRSMADVAAAAGLGEVALLFADRNAQGEFAEERAGVSALFVAQQRALQATSDHEVRAHRVRGGMSQIAVALAAGLPDAVVRLGQPVDRVRWWDDGAEVHAGHQVLEADRVIVACALPAARRITFDPPLPQPLDAAVRELGYGTVTKTALQFAARSWPVGYTNTDLPSQRVYEPTIDQPGDAGILMAYTGGDGGRRLAALDEAQRMAGVAGDMQSMFGLGAPLGGFSRAWSAEPRFGGSYAAYRPGQVTAHWAALRVGYGPIRLAGEHVATCTGYLEGAVESGETVAEWAIGTH